MAALSDLGLSAAASSGGGGGSGTGNFAPVTLTDGATVNTDASLSNNFKLTKAINGTLANPTNLTSGQTYTWEITQDATGSRTLAYGNLFLFPSGVAPVLSTPANSKDVISFYYNGTSLLFLGLTKALA